MRAAVFGVNDGLVSNLSLIMGVAGANAQPRFVLLAGVTGLLAGAFSMAAGEFISMSAQRELAHREIALERREIAADPPGEQAELALIYQGKGLSEEAASQVAALMMTSTEVALDAHVREELGLNPAELGSPWGAAASSFGAFLAGAIVPVLPYAFWKNPTAFAVSLALSGLSLFGIGAVISAFTETNRLFGGARMLLIGALAAAVTYGVGHLLGVSTGL